MKKFKVLNKNWIEIFDEPGNLNLADYPGDYHILLRTDSVNLLSTYHINTKEFHITLNGNFEPLDLIYHEINEFENDLTFLKNILFEN